MKLVGSCHCQAVRFTVQSHEPVPFMRCYCSICRKTAGTGGYAINLGADYGSLKVKGKKHLGVYRAVLVGEDSGETGKHKKHGGKKGGKEKRSSGQRHFCKKCGTALWLWDPSWPDLVHPHAGAIDSELPVPPENVHILLDSKANWVKISPGDRDGQFERYPEESLAQWHDRLGLRSM